MLETHKKVVSRRTGGILSTIFLFFILLTSSYALETFPTIAGENENYLLGNNIFTSAEETFKYPRNLDAAQVLVEDLDGDGINEIISMDLSGAWNQDYIIIYQENTLEPKATKTINSLQQGNSNLEIIDIDNDGKKEILIYKEDHVTNGNESIVGWEFNGTHLNLDFQVRINIAYPDGDRWVLSCNDDHDLCIVHAMDDSGGAEIHIINETGYNSGIISVGSGECYSGGNHIQFEDINPNNGQRIEFAIPYIDVVDGNSQLRMQIFSVDHNLISTLSSDYSIEIDLSSFDLDDFSDASPSCKDYEPKLSQVLAYNFDGIESNGKELIVAVSDSSDNFRMFGVTNTGALIDDYPEHQIQDKARGKYVSNPIPAKIFQDTDFDEFCVMGFNSPENDLVCGSILNNAEIIWIFTTDSITFYLPQQPYNITYDYFTNKLNLYEVDALEFNLNELTEFGSAVGINSIQDYRTSVEATLEFQTPYSDGSVIYVDVEKSGFEDIIYYDDDNIIYIDDGYTDVSCDRYNCISNIEFNPCYTEVIKLNETMQLLVTASDWENDDINLLVEVYESLLYEQNQTSLNISSGATSSFLFTLNHTISNGKIKISAWDNENPNDPHIVEYSFSVASQGVEYGDITCTESITQDDPFTEAEEDDLAEEAGGLENIISDPVEDLADEAGTTALGMWYLFLLCFTGFIVFGGLKSKKINGYETLGLCCIFGAIMLVTGVVFSVVPISHIISLIIIYIGGISITIRGMVLGGG